MTAVVGDVSYAAYGNVNAVSTTSTFTYNPITHGQIALITFTNAITVTMGAPTGIVEGAMFKFILKDGDALARTFAWNTAYKFPSATATINSGNSVNGSVSVISFIGGAGNTLIYDGHNKDIR